MRRSPAIPCMVMALVAVLGAGPRPGHAQYSTISPDIASDDFLQYTLSDLKTRLQEMVDANNKLAARNNAMRKRMLTLKEHLRQLEDQKLSLLEEGVALSDGIKLDSKEAVLVHRTMKGLEAQWADAQEQRAQWESESRRLERKRDETGAAVESLRREVEEVRRQNDERRNVLKTRAEEDRLRLRQEARDLKSRRDTVERDHRDLDTRLSAARRELASLADDQSILKDRLKEYRRGNDFEAGESKRLQAEVKRLQKSQKDHSNRIAKKVEDLRAYRAGLEQAVAGGRDLRQQILDSSRRQDSAMAASLDHLRRERQELDRQRIVVAAALEVLKEGRDTGARQDDLRRELAQAQEQRSAAHAARQDLKDKILDQEKMAQDLKAQQKAVVGQMDAMRKDLKRLTRRTTSRKEDVLREKKDALTAMLKNYRAGRNGGEQQDGKIASQISERMAQMQALNSRKAELENALKDAAAQMDVIGQARTAALQEAEAIRGQEGVADAALQAQVDELEKKSEVLEASLALVRSKYAEDEKMSEEFKAEGQQELEEYLKILQEENSGLKTKMSDLSKAIQAQAASEPASSPEMLEKMAAPALNASNP